MLTQPLIICWSTLFFFFNILSTQAAPFSTAKPPFLWTNSLTTLVQTSHEDGSQFRSVLSLPLPDLNNNYQPALVCGFFCNLTSDDYFFAVVLQSNIFVGFPAKPDNTLPPPQVVWAANLRHPVKEYATLNFSQDGDLVLQDADGSQVWSTNTAGRSVVGMKLTESGSLVLFDNKSIPVWNSANYPTDTLVLGQSLKKGKQLTSTNISAPNWPINIGKFYLTIANGGLEAYVDSNPPQLYYRNAKSWEITKYVTFKNGSLDAYTSFDVQEPFMALTPASSAQFMRLESDGHLRHYGLEEDRWKILDDVFSLEKKLDPCDYPTVCGEYGLCEDNQCNCPVSFRQVDARHINRGCYFGTPLSCQSIKNHELWDISRASYFTYNDLDAAVLGGIDKEQCKQACLKNCSCKAAFFRFTEDASNGSCYLPSQIFSIRSNDPQVSGYNSSASIKVQTSREQPHDLRVLALILGVVTVVTVIGLSPRLGLIILELRREPYLRIGNEDNFELASGLPKKISFEELKAATENFSRKLGEGGFGSVFEGTLNGERVAVKQLEGVGQGIKEFLAEVKTIGNIHHINLVRLIGYCSEKSSRLLVYEYMCNGSLDKWIFFMKTADSESLI